MKLPHLIKDDHSAHFLIILLSVTNSILIIVIFFILIPQSKKLSLAGIIPVSAQTPVVSFNLVSPPSNSVVSGTVPLVTTLTNGPKITSAILWVDGRKIQTLTSQKTQRLTIFWDSTKLDDGKHVVVIQVGQDNNHTSSITTTFEVNNNVSRSQSKK